MPGDYQTYVGPPVASDTVNPGFPKWMYHPVNPAQIVPDPVTEAALIAQDPQWTEKDPNATT